MRTVATTEFFYNDVQLEEFKEILRVPPLPAPSRNHPVINGIVRG